MADLFQPGDRVSWRYIPRGGYGYVLAIPAIVRTLGKRIGIDVLTVGGEIKRRYVCESSLLFRTTTELIDEVADV